MDQIFTIGVAEIVCSVTGLGTLLAPASWAGVPGQPTPTALGSCCFAFELFDELKASGYRRLTRVPLAAVSPNPACTCADPNVIGP